jgi:pimeloyl-ACP methyl ester carboxylesterase
MYWSGSHARFYGVTWDGYDTQTPVNITINLHTNEVHAFQTASALATFLDTLNGTNFVAAHSLGNMVLLAALNDHQAPINSHFMIDAAVALEAIYGPAAINTNMVPPDWLSYSNTVWPSEFFKLFPTNDARNQLTWSNRLANFNGANVYNFYSSGEEVLRNDPSPPESLVGLAETAVINNVWNDTPYASYLWCLSEKEKGRMDSDLILGSYHGG